MDCLKTRVIISTLFLLLFQGARAGSVSGKVTDENNEPLPFVSVYLQGTTQGVTTNKEGNYSIELPVGEHDLVFQFIGYKKHPEKVKIQVADQKIILNVKMELQPYEIGTVTINASGEDPAYEVMRKAIKMRKFYLSQVSSYSCDVYIKGVQRVTSYPKKFMGFDVNAEGDIDPKTGIFYLSESVSKFYFKQPDKAYEKMISSKVSGNSKAFSFNRTTDLLLNFYQNVVNVQVIAKRGFVSPIAEGAMFYYKYRLLGTFFENGKLVNKVEVIPKRDHDPAFRGIIFICENTWRIHSTDLYLVKDAGIEVIDTLKINQVHLPVKTSPGTTPSPVLGEATAGWEQSSGGEVWMLFSNKLTFSFSVMSFKGNGMYLSIHSKYNVKPDLSVKNPIPFAPIEQATTATLLPKELKQKKKDEKKENKGFNSGEMMKVEEDANKKDSVYWAETRPVPLTQEEVVDYKKKDSIQVLKESKPFLDSVDKKTNRFELIDILFGYEHVNRYKKRNISFDPIIQSVQFNTVQGLVLGTQLEIRRKYEGDIRFYKALAVSYGFSDKRINASGQLLYEFNPKKFSHVTLEAGRKTVQFNEKRPISSLVNSSYTLFYEENYMKLYQKDLAKLSYNSELANGVYLRSFLEYSDRTALLNTSDFVLFPGAKNHKAYTSNDPLFPEQDSTPGFSQNQALELRLSLRLRYKQKYITRPDEKWVYGSKYPTLHLEYRKGINAAGSDVNYDLVKVNLSDRMNFKLLGKATYLVSAGKFLNNSKMELMDHYHFSGNKTVISNFDFSDFQLLDYYTWSTKEYFIEAHYEHDFSGFILNKFPLLRKLKVNELAGIHYLYTEKIQNYTEVFFGLEKLNLLRIDFVMGFSENQKMATGVRLGLKIGR